MNERFAWSGTREERERRGKRARVTKVGNAKLGALRKLRTIQNRALG